MTLTLDDVRNKRFRMARKSGYEVLEVDEFVDQVEAAFEQLTDENQNLKKQIESLRSGGATPAPSASAPSPDAAPQTTQQPPQTIVVTTAKEASPAVVRLVELTTEQSERLVAEATEDANRIRQEASRNAQQLTSDAQTRAERIESEARANAERVQGDALSRAEALDRDIDTRRVEMFGELEQQRDQLTTTVEDLRSFEASYRQTLAAELHNQIKTLETTRAEPDEVPEGAQPSPGEPEASTGSENLRDSDDDGPPTLGGGSTSDTPRLDALLGDQR
ncbi:DivIVA domain-containing protein [Microbacterium sp.]|uniref:DivIVA domain-containing protein n=1 Tax=Microbacterium sp. TaxID=51671 RepID=UPI002E37C56C|nr:DivIVA domain-containing protein [Microbacterium sp.]HEX5730052.1 DivIVA domain-containing protein [Microbacterium sp.]